MFQPFSQPLWFLLLLLLPVLYVWSRQPGKIWAKWPSLLELAPTVASWRTQILALLPFFRMASLVFLILAMARPQKTIEESTSTQGIDIVLAIDVSPSMLALDFDPNRLAVAKQVAQNFVLRRTGDRIGLVSFAREAFTECPLTTDKQILNTYIHHLSADKLESGTAIGLGLATALNRLKDTSVSNRIVILMTDGENNAGFIAPLQAAEIAMRQGVKVYTVGIGSNGMVMSPILQNPDGSYEYEPRYTEIDESLLQHISRSTGGKYYRALNESDLEEIYRDIDQLEKTKVEVTVTRHFEERFWLFLWIALGILVAELLLRWGLLRTIGI